MTAKADSSQEVLAESRLASAKEERAVTRAAGVVGLWTSLSRVLGFVRDLVIAMFMGATMGADAFFVAFRIPNLLRRLFAEGALTAAFVPTYVETLQHGGAERAEKLARRTFTLAAVVLATVTILGIAFSPWIVRAIAWGFTDNPHKFELTVDLNRIMWPYLFFISLVALASGVLNSMGVFAPPAAAPLLLNICMIGSVSLAALTLGAQPEYSLAWGVTVAGVAQLALQLPFIRRVGVRLRPDFRFNDPELKRIGRLFVPAALAGAVYQINVLIGTILASLLPGGSISWLYYADRLVELPLGVFAVTLGVAALPSMSRLASSKDMVGLASSTGFAIRLMAFFTVPACAGLILLREPIVACLFQRGLFGYEDTMQTSYALFWYTVGLPAFSGLKVVNQVFFSLKDTRTPLLVATATVVVNLVAGLLLMGPMKHGGLALATSLAATVNVGALCVILVPRLGTFPLNELMRALGKFALASCVMGALLIYGRSLGNWSAGPNPNNLLILGGCVVGGLVAFVSACYILKCSELRSILGMVTRGGKR